jgi:hypothetical protein
MTPLYPHISAHHGAASQEHCLMTLIVSQDEGAEHLSLLCHHYLPSLSLSSLQSRPLCYQSNQGIELEHLYNGIEVELL